MSCGKEQKHRWKGSYFREVGQQKLPEKEPFKQSRPSLDRSISVTTASAKDLSQGGVQALKESQWRQRERAREAEATVRKEARPESLLRVFQSQGKKLLFYTNYI